MGMAQMNKWMNRAGRGGGRGGGGGGEVDAWSCRRQGGRQAENSWASTVSYQLTAGWQSIQDIRTDTHTRTPKHTQTDADHCANVQTLREWKNTTEGRKLEPQTELHATYKCAKAQSVTQLRLKKGDRVTGYTKCTHPWCNSQSA